MREVISWKKPEAGTGFLHLTNQGLSQKPRIFTRRKEARAASPC
jgi:hypothetical protein